MTINTLEQLNDVINDWMTLQIQQQYQSLHVFLPKQTLYSFFFFF